MLLAVQTWCESSQDSSHIFVVPRVMQREFGRISKHIGYVGQSWDLPASISPTVPLLMYYLPPFNRQLTFDLSLARKRIAPPSKQKMPRFVKEQVAEMHGL